MGAVYLTIGIIYFISDPTSFPAWTSLNLKVSSTRKNLSGPFRILQNNFTIGFLDFDQSMGSAQIGGEHGPK